MRQAACIGMTDLFFPAEGERETDRDRRESQACEICDRCPVIQQCNTFRLTRACTGGVLAGVLPGARRRRRKEQAIEAMRPSPFADPTDIVVYDHYRALDAEIRQYQMQFDTAV